MSRASARRAGASTEYRSMGQTSPDVVLFGSTQPHRRWRAVEVGALTFEVCEGKVRKVRWNGVEMIRGVELLVRDPRGGTLPANVAAEKLDATDSGAAYDCRFDVPGAACTIRVVAGTNDTLTIDAEVAPTEEMVVNRAGLVILHPLELAGTAFEIQHGDGKSVGMFPDAIQVTAPATDIRGIAYRRGTASVEIALEGEVFEMEDQRNWTDASFKTYSRPLSWQHPFALLPPPAPPIRQRLVARFDGKAAGYRPAEAQEAARIALSDRPIGRLPAIATPIQPGSRLPQAGVLAALGEQHMLVRLDGTETVREIRETTRDLAVASVDLELIVPDAYARALAALDAIAGRIDEAGLHPRHVVAVPRGHPHLGKTDGIATPERLLPRLRYLFPSARIGGGPLSDFADLNCAPAAADAEFITFATAGVVHDADDDRVVETLTALPQVFADAARSAGARPLRIGLASIGLRRFPAATATPDNPDQRRLPAVAADPRQRGIFAAAFAVGAMAACAGFPVQSIALATLTGPHGMTFVQEPWPQPGYGGASPRVFPLFHVVRQFMLLSGAPRLDVSGVTPPLYGVAARRGDDTVLVLANLGQTTRTVVLPARGRIRSLDALSFADAIANERWLDDVPPANSETVVLPPFATAFVLLPLNAR